MAFIHRFGGYLNSHVHYHVLAPNAKLRQAVVESAGPAGVSALVVIWGFKAEIGVSVSKQEGGELMGVAESGTIRFEIRVRGFEEGGLCVCFSYIQ